MKTRIKLANTTPAKIQEHFEVHREVDHYKILYSRDHSIVVYAYSKQPLSDRSQTLILLNFTVRSLIWLRE